MVSSKPLLSNNCFLVFRDRFLFLGALFISVDEGFIDGPISFGVSTSERQSLAFSASVEPKI